MLKGLCIVYEMVKSFENGFVERSFVRNFKDFFSHYSSLSKFKHVPTARLVQAA